MAETFKIGGKEVTPENFIREGVGYKVTNNVSHGGSLGVKRDGRGFNVASFLSYWGVHGPLRTNSYIVLIPWPTGMMGIGDLEGLLRPVEQRLELACDSVNLPMTGVQTYNVQRYGYGAVETRPTLPKFSPMQCTFLCDSNMLVSRFFHEWIKRAVNYDFYDSITGRPTNISGRAAEPYEIGYKHEYSVDMFLKVFDQYGEEVRYIRFREAYPTEVGDVPLSWGRRNEIMKIPVGFTFFDWTELTPENGEAPGTVPFV